MLVRFVVCFVAGAVFASSQEPRPDADQRRDDLLARVAANVARYHATLPSITTDEDIVSSLSQHGLYRAHGIAHATLRISSGRPGEKLSEARTYLVLDGKAVPPGKKVSVPFQLDGAFSHVAEIFFSAENLPCYRFTLLSQPAPDGSAQLAFVTNPQLPAACTNNKTVVAGLARIDPATAQLRHVERTVTSSADGEHTVTFIEVDYAPSMIGGQSLWLPTQMTADLDHGRGSFAARYSNYHRYTSTATLLPAGTAEAPVATPPPRL